MAKARFTHSLCLLFSCFLAIALPGFLFVTASAQGAGFEELRRFSRTGVAPSGLVFGPNGQLYGVTTTGGSAGYGTLYSVNPQTGAVTTVANFTGAPADGNPDDRIAADASNVYGVSHSAKTIWRWNPASGLTRATSLYALSAAGYGSFPGLGFDNEGRLFGMFIGSASAVTSKLWRWVPGGGPIELGTFDQAITGPLAPTKLAVDSQGAIYGCSAVVNHKTILWRWKAVGGFEKLAELPVDAYGSEVPGVSIDANDQVWGNTLTGGVHQNGTLWRWTPEGGVVKLGDFNSPQPSAQYGSAVIFAADGTPLCLSGNIIWKWTAADGLVSHGDVSAPEIGFAGGAIALDNTGALFGTSGFGSPSGRIWKWTAAGGVVKLADSPDPNFTISEHGLARDAQGRLYGATSSPEESAILWRWSNAGGYEVLTTFNPAIYGRGKTLPTLDSLGNVYGLVETDNTGLNLTGRIWRWNAGEGLVNLARPDLLSEGYSTSNIVIGSGGAIYGVGNSGSISYKGARMWKWTAADSFKTVGSFSVKGPAFSPGQITGPDGEWYGTGDGFWSYSETAGKVKRGINVIPNKVLARDAAGNIYGTGRASSSMSFVLWKLSQPSGYSQLATFDQSSGTDPVSVYADSTGTLVRGICRTGGMHGAGTLWSWTEVGGLQVIHHFDPQNPVPTQPSTLSEDNDGNLCGLTGGLLWRYVAGPGPDVTLSGATTNPQSVKFIGSVSPNGSSATARLQWGESADSFSNSDQIVNVSGAGDQKVSFELSGLPQNRTLFARLIAVNSQGVSLSNVISFTSPNIPPQAVSDVVHSPVLSGPNFSVDVLANDSDPGDTLTLVSVEQGEHGLAEIVDNKIRYTPGASYQGEDRIVYTASDGHGGFSEGTLEFYNGVIIAQNDFASRGQGNLTILPLANDSDEDGDELRIVSVTQPQYSTVTFTDTTLVFDPGDSVFGSEHFTYTVTDGRGRFATAGVEIRSTTIDVRGVLKLGVGRTGWPFEFGGVKAFGSPGTALGGMLRLQGDGRPGSSVKWMLFNSDDLSPLFAPFGELPGMPGTTVTSIEEPAGRAALVKFASGETPKKRRHALLFFDTEGESAVVSYEGAVLGDQSQIVSIDRYSEANGHVFLLARIRQPNGKTVQSLRVWHAGQVEELIRGGTTQVNGVVVKSIKTLVPVAGSPAVNRWIDDTGRIAALVTLADRNKAIVVCQAGEDPRVEVSTPVGFDGSRILQLGPPVLGPSRTAFRRVSSNILSPRTISLWHTDPELVVDHILSVGATATEEPLTSFAGLGDPVAGANDSYAFIGSVRKGLGNPGARSWKSLCWLRGSQIHLVDPNSMGSPAERPGSIKSFALSPQSTRGPVFTVKGSKGLSLWVLNDSGSPHLLAKPGDLLTINGEERKVVSVRALEGTSGRGIANRAFDASGRVQAIIKFDDFSTYLVEFSLP